MEDTNESNAPESHTMKTININKELQSVLLKENRDAYAIWMWAQQKPSGWTFRKDDIYEELNFTQKKYAAARKVLCEYGLWKTITEHDPITNCITKSTIFIFDVPHAYGIKNEIGRIQECRKKSMKTPVFTPRKNIDSPYNTNMPAKAESENNNSDKAMGYISKQTGEVTTPDEFEAMLPVKHVEPLVFLRSFPGNVLYQTFDDVKGRGDNSLARIPSANELKRLNDNGAGIFFCVQEMKGRKRANAEMKEARYFIADFDGEGDIVAALNDKPSMVVRSSPGKYHLYWRAMGITDAKLFSQIQKNIIRKYGSDKAISDAARVLRLPGFYHRKGDPFLVECIYMNHQAGIDAKTTLEIWPPAPRRQFSAPRFRENRGEFKGKYGAGEGERNVHIFRRGCGAKSAGRDYASEMRKENEACNPSLPEYEIEAIIKQVARY